MTARAAGPMGSLASPSSGLSERRWVNPSLSLAGLCPLQRSSGQVEFCLNRPRRSIGRRVQASLRNASARSVFSHVNAVKVSLLSTRLPPMISFHE